MAHKHCWDVQCQGSCLLLYRRPCRCGLPLPEHDLQLRFVETQLAAVPEDPGEQACSMPCGWMIVVWSAGMLQAAVAASSPQASPTCCRRPLPHPVAQAGGAVHPTPATQRPAVMLARPLLLGARRWSGNAAPEHCCVCLVRGAEGGTTPPCADV
jgi:hypothetical protein